MPNFPAPWCWASLTLTPTYRTASRLPFRGQAGAWLCPLPCVQGRVGVGSLFATQIKSFAPSQPPMRPKEVPLRGKQEEERIQFAAGGGK